MLSIRAMVFSTQYSFLKNVFAKPDEYLTGTIEKRLKALGVLHHICLGSWSNPQFAKGIITALYSNPFDLCMVIILMAFCSSDKFMGVVMPNSFHHVKKPEMLLPLFFVYFNIIS